MGWAGTGQYESEPARSGEGKERFHSGANGRAAKSFDHLRYLNPNAVLGEKSAVHRGPSKRKDPASQAGSFTVKYS